MAWETSVNELQNNYLTSSNLKMLSPLKKVCGLGVHKDSFAYIIQGTLNTILAIAIEFIFNGKIQLFTEINNRKGAIRLFR